MLAAEATSSLPRLPPGFRPKNMLDPYAGFDVDALAGILGSSSQQIKGVLRSQSVIAGIGNAYSDEILHAAQLLPFRKRSTDLDPAERALGRLKIQLEYAEAGEIEAAKRGRDERIVRIRKRERQRRGPSGTPWPAPRERCCARAAAAIPIT